MKNLLLIIVFFSSTSFAQLKTSILINTDILKSVGYISENEAADVLVYSASHLELEELMEKSHDFNRCGGFEILSNDESSFAILTGLQSQLYNDQVTLFSSIKKNKKIEFNKKILEATEILDQENLRQTVNELSSYRTRSSRQPEPNLHVEHVKKRIEEITRFSKLPIVVSLVEHTRTKQKTLKVRITGSQKPEQVVILGGHLDSTSFFRQEAPGADDNASGSANLLEILRVLIQQEQPLRSVEFFWYAAEEVGLVGSSQIAKEYLKNEVDVIGVLQLDMTGYPGSDTYTIANVTDYTSPWLQNVLVQLNNHYAGALMVTSKCGYGCSDHASWYRQGFPTAFPIEAKFKEANKSIHSKHDVVTKLNFEHSLIFSKLGLSFAMQLANSELRDPGRAQKIK